jgi:hypothetical protein
MPYRVLRNWAVGCRKQYNNYVYFPQHFRLTVSFYFAEVSDCPIWNMIPIIFSIINLSYIVWKEIVDFANVKGHKVRLTLTQMFVIFLSNQCNISTISMCEFNKRSKGKWFRAFFMSVTSNFPLKNVLPQMIYISWYLDWF